MENSLLTFGAIALNGAVFSWFPVFGGHMYIHRMRKVLIYNLQLLFRCIYMDGNYSHAN